MEEIITLRGIQQVDEIRSRMSNAL